MQEEEKDRDLPWRLPAAGLPDCEAGVPDWLWLQLSWHEPLDPDLDLGRTESKCGPAELGLFDPANWTGKSKLAQLEREQFEPFEFERNRDLAKPDLCDSAAKQPCCFGDADPELCEGTGSIL